MWPGSGASQWNDDLYRRSNPFAGTSYTMNPFKNDSQTFVTDTSGQDLQPGGAFTPGRWPSWAVGLAVVGLILLWRKG